MPLEKTCEMIGDLTSRLPTEKVRAMACDLDIIGCLAAVTRGVDLVASDYPSKLALEGKAILYDLSFEGLKDIFGALFRSYQSDTYRLHAKSSLTI